MNPNIRVVKVSADQQAALAKVVKLVDRCCEEHLSDEFRGLCHAMLAEACGAGVSLKRGKPASWAAGVVFTLARVNCVDVDTETIAEEFGVSTATVYAKSKVIREALDVELPTAWYRGPGGDVLRVFESVLRHGDDLPVALGELLGHDGSTPLPVLDEEPPPAAAHGYELQVVLLNTSPEVSRTLRVPDLTFEELHFVLQGAFAWEECHLHEFECEGFKVVDEGAFRERMDEPGDRPEWATRLSQVLPDGGRRKPKFVYVYDFGDGWEHGVKMTRVLHGDEVPEHPVCIDGANAAPPEDCGGPWGYADLCDALADPTHPEHSTFMEWCGPIDPTAFRLEEVNASIRDFGVIEESER